MDARCPHPRREDPSAKKGMNWVWRSRNGKVRGLGGAALAGLASGPLSEWVVERPARWTPARELQVDSRQTFERQPRLPAERELLGPSNGGKSNARWCLDGPATHRRRFADFAGLLQSLAGIRMLWMNQTPSTSQ